VGVRRRKAMRGGCVRICSAIFLAGTCLLSGCGGSDSDLAGANGPGSPPPAGGAPPTLTGTPANTVWQGTQYVFAPRATDPERATLSFVAQNAPRWANFNTATGRLSGTPSPSDIGDVVGIRIGVSDGQHTVWLPPFDLSVRPVSNGSVLLTWQSPSENTDETPLSDLAGFHLYWGTDPHEPSHSVTVGTNTLSYQFSGLSPGLYYFSTTAVNTQGMESDLSDAVAMLVR